MMRKHLIGTSALVIGVTALGLAVIPEIALDRPVPLFADRQDDPPPKPDPRPKRALTIKLKKFFVTLGKDKQPQDEQSDEDERVAVAKPEKVDRRAELLKWFTVSAVSCVLVGLLLGPISWVRERQPVLAGCGIGLCCLALVWQYVVLGIVAGVAAALFVFVLSQLAG